MKEYHTTEEDVKTIDTAMCVLNPLYQEAWKRLKTNKIVLPICRTCSKVHLCFTSDDTKNKCEKYSKYKFDNEMKEKKGVPTIPVDVVKEMMLKWVGEEAAKHIEVLIGEYLRGLK